MELSMFLILGISGISMLLGIMCATLVLLEERKVSRNNTIAISEQT